MPSRDPRSSGHRKAEPAYAASTCSHSPSLAPDRDQHTKHTWLSVKVNRDSHWTGQKQQLNSTAIQKQQQLRVWTYLLINGVLFILTLCSTLIKLEFYHLSYFTFYILESRCLKTASFPFKVTLLFSTGPNTVAVVDHLECFTMKTREKRSAKKVHGTFKYGVFTTGSKPYQMFTQS